MATILMMPEAVPSRFSMGEEDEPPRRPRLDWRQRIVVEAWRAAAYLWPLPAPPRRRPMRNVAAW